MESFSAAALEGAQKSIASTLRKNEKVYITLSEKENPRASQMKMVSTNIKNFRLMLMLVENKLDTDCPADLQPDELEELFRAIPHYVEQIEKIKPKFKAGTPQFTLATRRIDAYCIAMELTKEALKL